MWINYRSTVMILKISAYTFWNFNAILTIIRIRLIIDFQYDRRMNVSTAPKPLNNLIDVLHKMFRETVYINVRPKHHRLYIANLHNSSPVGTLQGRCHRRSWNFLNHVSHLTKCRLLFYARDEDTRRENKSRHTNHRHSTINKCE